METVENLLRTKSSCIWSIEPDATAYQALEFMAEKNIGALLVTQKEKLVGIFSERDYARKVILQGKSSKETLVSELMTREVCYVTPNSTIEECMALMTEKHVRHLPVLANGTTLIGIVTLGDVIKQIITHQEFTIRELEKYITS
ncbi:MAG: CBS domain-containing protein [SAR324 cluster bacterium]|nr:CBS domain-containing protein [SAR324 cluster bacterium]